MGECWLLVILTVYDYGPRGPGFDSSRGLDLLLKEQFSENATTRNFLFEHRLEKGLQSHWGGLARRNWLEAVMLDLKLSTASIGKEALEDVLS